MSNSRESGVAESREVLVITGMSGAGRSTVANTLEDLGWYVVDNLPPSMIRGLIDMKVDGLQSAPRIAIVVDVRGGVLFDDAMALIETLRRETPLSIIFLDASDETLVRRFEQVRRPHPLQGNGTLTDGIRVERARLEGLRGIADLIVDTSDLNVHQLSSRIKEQFSDDGHAGLTVAIMSFGFKYGLPVDADIVADMRFLPNPFWNPELKEHNGTEQVVADFVLGQEGAAEFLEHFPATLRPVLQGYQRENKHHAVIAIGCTGGKHRSVAMAERLARGLAAEPGVVVNVKHRDLGRE